MTAERLLRGGTFAVALLVVVGTLGALITLEVTADDGAAAPVVALAAPVKAADGIDVPWRVENRGATVATRVLIDVEWGGPAVRQEIDYLPPGGAREGVVRFQGSRAGEPSAAVVAWQAP